MPRLRIRALLALVVGLVLALGAAPARAEKYQSTKVDVTWIDGDGKHHEEEFNLADDAQRARLKKMIDDDQVIQIAKQKPVSILEISADLGLWTVVVFLLLFLILRKSAWKPMLEGLKRREENIYGALTEAQKAREEAKALRDSLQQEMDKLSDKIREEFEKARQEGQKVKDSMLAEAKTMIAGERDRAQRELQTAKDQALQEIWNQTAQLATLVSAKTIRRQISPEDHRRLVDEALAELRGSVTDLRQEVWGNKA